MVNWDQGKMLQRYQSIALVLGDVETQSFLIMCTSISYEGPSVSDRIWMCYKSNALFTTSVVYNVTIAHNKQEVIAWAKN